MVDWWYLKKSKHKNDYESQGCGFPNPQVMGKEHFKEQKSFFFPFNIFCKFRILYPDPKRLIVVFGFKLCVATLGQWNVLSGDIWTNFGVTLRVKGYPELKKNELYGFMFCRTTFLNGFCFPMKFTFWPILGWPWGSGCTLIPRN